MTPAEQQAYYANDYLAEDGVETVTLTPPSGYGLSEVTDAKARFGELTRRELALLAPELVSGQVGNMLTLYTATLGTLTPSAGYMVTRADGSKWNITGSTLAKFGTQYVCTATRGR